MVSTPGTIVVGIDGSEPSTRALHWAIEQAQAEHRPLTLLHSIHSVTPAYLDAAADNLLVARAELEAVGRRVLAAARATTEAAAPDIEVHEVFDLADPRDMLLQLSEHAAMVVVGSRGLGRVRRLLLGSVSVALVRHAHCPVVVLRPEHVGTVRRGILVGIDTSAESQPVLEFAYREAALRDVPLTVLHSKWDIRAGSTGAYLVADSVVDNDRERLGLSEAMVGMAEKYPEVHVTSRLAKGLPEQVLVGQSDQMNLVVVGAHQNNRFSQAMFGSVSLSVAEHAKCPVAVIPLSAAR